MKHELTTKHHKDVDGKDQFFLYIGEGEKQFRMNIGKSTFEKVNALNDENKKDTKETKKIAA